MGFSNEWVNAATVELFCKLSNGEIGRKGDTVKIS